MKTLFLILGAASGVIAIARLFYLNELAEDPNYPEMLFWFVIMGLSVLMIKASQRAKRPKPAKKKESVSTGAMETNDLLAELSAMAGSEDRAEAIPAWSLRLRDPFEPSRDVTSWIGGAPKAPVDFNWPRTVEGKPMLFVAQIDLGEVKSQSGQLHPKLPRTGAMLVFIAEPAYTETNDGTTYAIKFISQAHMTTATPAPLPDDHPKLSDVGFWIKKQTFHYWPIDLVPYIDTDVEQSEPKPNRGTDWIDTWGVAAFEVKNVQTALKNDRNQRRQFTEWRARNPDADLSVHQKRQSEDIAAMEPLDAPLQAALDSFVAQAESMPSDAPVEPQTLQRLMQLRKSVADKLQGNTQLKIALTPSNLRTSQNIEFTTFDATAGAFNPEKLDAGFLPILKKIVTEHRYHRLFGLSLPPSTQLFELRGMDCLISIYSDRLIGNETEHESGFSIWCEREAMAEGRFDAGRVIWHTNV